MENSINVENLSIDFPIYDRASKSVRAQIEQKTGLAQAREVRVYHALKNINVSLKDGDRVGLIGQNGAGKSTFLKSLAQIYAPTSGRVEVKGDISSLFNVAIGLDAEASGFDNIHLLMAARAIPLKFYNEVRNQVIEFSELGDALYRPVRTYSAGMRLRLAFAVATARSSQILLLDEVVGVGDAKFREKSRERIETLMHGAGILVIASHSSHFLKTYCTRGLVFDRGELIFDGSISDAIAKHNN